MFFTPSDHPVVSTNWADYRDSLTPRRQIWCDSARDWVNDLSRIPGDARITEVVVDAP